ncbi:MAG TPA: hypothetical protein DHV85_04190 [Candidatus Accumulibacter sp.]|nr:hypothetical protein [Accumulibacter sp.]
MSKNHRLRASRGYQSNTAGQLLLRASDYPPASVAAVGSSGLRILTFIAEQPGGALLHLKLWREWKGNSSAIEVFTVTVRITAR